MAFSISELNTVSKKYFEGPAIKQQAYDLSPFYAYLKAKKKIRYSGGTSIQFPIRYRQFNQGGGQAPRQQVTFQSYDTRTGGDVEWKFYIIPQLMHWDEKAKNAGVGQIVDLLKDKSQEQKEEMADVLATALYATSQGTYEIEPLSTIVDSAAAYAGISVSDATTWKAQEDNARTTLLIDGQYSLNYYRNLCTFGRFKPTHHFTTRNLASKYESLLTPNVRYEDKMMANLGFDNVTFHGKPVIGDYYCTEKYWYGLDMEQFELVVHEDYDMDYGKGWFSLEQAGFPYAVGKTLACMLNTICRMRQTSFKYTLLDYTKG